MSHELLIRLNVLVQYQDCTIISPSGHLAVQTLWRPVYICAQLDVHVSSGAVACWVGYCPSCLAVTTLVLS